MKPLSRTIELGGEFWNDSCSPKELAEAVSEGATGATSNPVIVHQVLKSDLATFGPLIDSIAREYRHATDEEVAWKVIAELATRAAKTLEPVYKETRGAKGFLSVQVNPKFYRDADRMFEHGKLLASLASNIAIKAPCTEAGIAAMERLTADGINVNATVSFSLSQAVAVAEAIERGLDQAKSKGRDLSKLHPYVTVMVGRLDDHLARVMTKEQIAVDPGDLNWAGIAVVRKAYGIFKERQFRSRLLVAAFRHHLHWSELQGEDVIFSIPYAYWKQFNASDIALTKKIREPIDATRLARLQKHFPDFRKAYEENAMKASEFTAYNPSVHTLNQFVNAAQELYALIRERMLALGL